MPTDPTATFLTLLDKIGLAGTILVALLVYAGWQLPKVAVYVKESVDRLLAASEATARIVAQNTEHLAEIRAQGAAGVVQHERMEATLTAVHVGVERLVKKEHAA